MWTHLKYEWQIDVPALQMTPALDGLIEWICTWVQIYPSPTGSINPVANAAHYTAIKLQTWAQQKEAEAEGVNVVSRASTAA